MRPFSFSGIASVMVVIAVAGCGSHSVVNSPRPANGDVSPFVVQNGKSPVNWVLIKPKSTFYTDFNGIIAGPTGDMWYGDYTGEGLDRITMGAGNKEWRISQCAATLTSSGHFIFIPNSCGSGVALFDTATDTEQSYTSPSGDETSYDGAAMAKSGNIWFTEEQHIATITTSGTIGTISEYAYTEGTTFAEHAGVALGSDGNIWFTEPFENYVSKIVPSTHKITNYLLGQACEPSGIAPGPDNDLYFTCGDSDNVGQITTSGAVTYFPTNIGLAFGAQTIVEGSDGNVYFLAQNPSTAEIGQLVVSTGTVNYLTATSSFEPPDAIASGPDGNLWMSAQQGVGDQIEVYVLNPMTVTPKGPTLAAPGDTVTLTVSENGTSSWTAKASMPSVATVAPVSGHANEFLVTAVAAGKCTISISDAVKNTFNDPVTVK